MIWYSDNAACASIACKGSMKEVLNPIMEKICKLCEENNIDLQVKWIQRTRNMVADELSRFVGLDDWGISESLMLRLQKDWFQCEVDRFASAKNARLKRFNSCFAETGSEVVDMFSQDWAGVKSWLVPLPQLIPHTI